MNTNDNPWKILSSQQIYDNPWIQLTEHQVINPSGNKGIYGTIHFKNIALGILPLDNLGYTYLVGQYRLPLQKYSWEIPEGGGALNIHPLESAQRELLEETGLQAQNWTELQRVHLSNSVSNELGIIYLAQTLSYQQAQPEETEQLQLQKLPFEQTYEMVMSGEITDSLSIIAILKVRILINSGQLSICTKD